MIDYITLAPYKAFPSLPAIGGDTASHTLALKEAKEAIEQHERRRGNPLDSFIRLRELIDVGVLAQLGDRVVAADDTVFGGSVETEFVQDTIGNILVDSSEINFVYNDGVPSITAALINASIVFARLQNFDALSVLGRSANSAGVGDEIAAAADGDILRLSGTTLGFGLTLPGAYVFTGVNNFQNTVQLGTKSGTSAPTHYALQTPNNNGIAGFSDGLSFRNASTSRTVSIFLGTSAPSGLSNPTSPNENSAGVNNVAVGAGALAALTTGFKNVGVGAAALRSLTTGSRNFAIGPSAGEFMVSSTDNTYVGEGAGRGQNTGTNAASSNVCVGSGAGEILVTGGDANVLIGLDSGGNMTTGNQNTCVGFDSGLGIETGVNNTFVGFSIFLTGNENTGVGALIGVGGINVGDQNTMLGVLAGENSVGSRNVFLGYNAGGEETGDDTLYIANTNTATPLIYGEFPNALLDFNADAVRLPNDNDQLQIGAGQDLRLYHDGTNSFIENNTGDLRLLVGGSLGVYEAGPTTGTSTATMVSTNKPGANNKTQPDTWLPVDLDGTTYYVPCYLG